VTREYKVIQEQAHKGTQAHRGRQGILVPRVTPALPEVRAIKAIRGPLGARGYKVTLASLVVQASRATQVRQVTQVRLEEQVFKATPEARATQEPLVTQARQETPGQTAIQVSPQLDNLSLLLLVAGLLRRMAVLHRYKWSTARMISICT
jgi:hypothetical protein